MTPRVVKPKVLAGEVEASSEHFSFPVQQVPPMLSVIIVILLTQTPKQEKPGPTPVTPKAKTLLPRANYNEKMGDDAVLYSRNKEGKLVDVIVSQDEKSGNEMAEAQQGRDDIRIKEIKDSGRADVLPSGTKVRIVAMEGDGGTITVIVQGRAVKGSAGPSHFRVRFAEGEYKDKTMIVSCPNVQVCDAIDSAKLKAATKKARTR